MSESEKIEKFVKLLKSQKKETKENVSTNINFLKNNLIDINARDSKGYNPFHYAIRCEKADLVYTLLNLEPSSSDDFQLDKADPNKEILDTKEHFKTSPLFFSLLQLNDPGISSRIIKSLINAGADLHYKDQEGVSFFLRLCETGKNDVINYILSLNPCPIKINEEVSKSGSALHIAILSDKEEICTQMLENDIDIGIVDKNNNTALHLAIIEKQFNYFHQILEKLVQDQKVENTKKKEILNAVNNEGNTILHEVAKHRNFAVENIILKLPKDIMVEQSIKNKIGYDYKELSKYMDKLELEEKENLEKEKKERFKKKQEEKRLKEEEERLLKEERKKMKEKMEKQEELGKNLMKYKGYIFLSMFICLMIILFALVKNATKKKERII